MRTEEESKGEIPCGRHVLGVYKGTEDGVVTEEEQCWDRTVTGGDRQPEGVETRIFLSK